MSIPDIAQQRGLSPTTLALFNLHPNGNGWEYQTKLADGGIAMRWKSYYSSRELAPEAEREAWAKYRWIPSKPAGANYFYPPSKSLTQAIQKADGGLYLVGGEIGVMTMLEAGYENTTCFFGDGAMPETFASDCKAWGVTTIHLVPDRDESGLAMAIAVRDALLDTLIQLLVYQLDFPFEPKHGKDVSDMWLDAKQDKDVFIGALALLDLWGLPNSKLPVITYPDLGSYETTDLPARFLSDIGSRLGIEGAKNDLGWYRKPVQCPFHNDEHPSAFWNDTKHILYCQSSCGGKVYLAKAVGEHYGLHLKDYFITETATLAMPTAKVEIAKPQEVKKQSTLRPALPPSLELTTDQLALAQTGRKWLNSYVEWAGMAANATPDIFHEAMGLWLLSTAATRRVKVQIGGLEIFPNLYLMIIAKTSVYCKSTGMKLAASVLHKANLDVLRLPSETTPEAMFDELAGIKPSNFEKLSEDVQKRWLLGRAFAAQKTIMKDEASSILANLRKEYMGGLAELLLQGYDSHSGTIDKRLQSRGFVSIKDLSLCFLGATTPAMWNKYIGIEEHENGLTPRFAVITPENGPHEHDVPDVVEMPIYIVSTLRRMFLDVLPGDYKTISPHMGEIISPPVTTATFDTAALNHIKAYNKTIRIELPNREGIDDSRAAAYARLATMVYKIAMLLATVESSTPAIHINLCHVYAAQQIVERWRESLHRLDVLVAQSKNGNISSKLLQYIQTSSNTGVTLRDIMRDVGFSQRAKALEELTTLYDEGLIERFERKPAIGRPAQCYRSCSTGTE